MLLHQAAHARQLARRRYVSNLLATLEQILELALLELQLVQVPFLLQTFALG